MAERRHWREWQPLRDLRQYVFLDECGVTTDLLRRYGRSPRGTRLRDHTPCSHWQTYTVIAALRLDGVDAPAVFDGPIDSPTFLAYVEQVLVPTLRSGDVIVLETRWGDFRYQVTGKRLVWPDDLTVLVPTPDDRLTLTSYAQALIR